MISLCNQIQSLSLPERSDVYSFSSILLYNIVKSLVRITVLLYTFCTSFHKNRFLCHGIELLHYKTSIDDWIQISSRQWCLYQFCTIFSHCQCTASLWWCCKHWTWSCQQHFWLNNPPLIQLKCDNKPCSIMNLPWAPQYLTTANYLHFLLTKSQVFSL